MDHNLWKRTGIEEYLHRPVFCAILGSKEKGSYERNEIQC